MRDQRLSDMSPPRTTMDRGSDSFLWGVRWETIEHHGNAPLFGALMPYCYATLDEARHELRRLQQEQPTQINPLLGGEPRDVRYFLIARRASELLEP